MSETVFTFVQRSGQIWPKKWLLLKLFRELCNGSLEIVDHWNKRDNNVMCPGKEIKWG